MGLRYRKSIKLGGGLRINLSKSGIGYSWGLPGFRISKSPNGTKQKTFYIPGTGISYVKRSSKKKENKNDEKIQNVYLDKYEVENLQTPVEDALYQALENLIKVNTFSNILLLTAPLILINYLFGIVPIIGLIIKLLLLSAWKLDLTYEFDNFSQKKYMCLKNSIETLSTSKKIWQINSIMKADNSKYNGGENITNRSVIKISKKTPFYIKNNIDIFTVKLKKGKILFTPDKLLYIKGLNVTGADFKDIEITTKETNYIETETIQMDAIVVDHTFKYTNKDGTKDKRRKNNPRYPVCKYGEIYLKSKNGINIYLYYSSSSIIESINSYFEEFKKYLDYSASPSKKETYPLYEEAKTFTLKQDKYLYKFDLMAELKIDENEAEILIDKLIENRIIKEDKNRFMFEKNKMP